MSESKNQKYTIAEVRKHNKADDLWFIIHDKVYDATKFLSEHPGGEDVLIDAAGRNATKDFDDADHSNSAKELMLNYYLGDIIDDEKLEKGAQENDKNKAKSKQKYCTFGLCALAIALGSIILYKGYKLSKSN